MKRTGIQLGLAWSTWPDTHDLWMDVSGREWVTLYIRLSSRGTGDRRDSGGDDSGAIQGSKPYTQTRLGYSSTDALFTDALLRLGVR